MSSPPCVHDTEAMKFVHKPVSGFRVFSEGDKRKKESVCVCVCMCVCVKQKRKTESVCVRVYVE